MEDANGPAPMDFDMAISDYPEAVRLNPHSAGAYYSRGNA